MLAKTVRGVTKRSMQGLHTVGLRMGLVVLPNHYYTPIADQTVLRKTRHQWAQRSSMRGIVWSVDQQAAYLRQHVEPYQAEFSGNAAFAQATAQHFGPGYGPIEAQALHGMVRSLKPNKIIEIGSGVSTFCILHALSLNEEDGYRTDVTCIEPYPSDFIKSNTRISLVPHPVERLDLAIFDTLEAGDFLFIDSTHAVRPCGDVECLFLEVIPRLKPGVVVHIHDIYLPYRYQRNLPTALFQWTETMLLQALLTNNEKLSVLMALSYLHYDAEDTMRQVFPDYRPQKSINGLAEETAQGHFPSSIYLLTS